MDRKVKKAERIDTSHLLGIDSPMVIWRTDLETLLGGEGGGSGSGPVEFTGGGSPPPPQTIQYAATCDAVNHEPGDGVFEGRWYGGLVQTWDEATALAGQHLDGLAYVAMYVDGIQVGPVVRH